MGFATNTMSENDKRNYIRQSSGNLFVEAGAGAGKTTFISKRIINQMKKGVSPSKFVFITFTNEATVELYTKIEKNIIRELKKAETLEELSVLTNALEKLPEMNIMTIYRFCYGLLVLAKKARGIKESDFVGSEGMNRGNRVITERTRRLLEEDTAFLENIRAKYRHIYADEFQDTDEDQAAVMLLIAGKNDETNTKAELKKLLSGSETAYKIRDDAIFVVGDGRQSIYRDEGARIEIFENVRRYMADNGNSEIIRLEENYRSEDEILEWINRRFENNFDDYVAMKGDWKINDPESFHGIWKVEVKSGNEKTPEALRRTDARETLGLVKRLLTDEKIYIEEKNSDATRRPIYSDFLVLLMREENVEEYVEEAEGLGIPAITTGKISIETNENAVRIMTLKKAKGLAGNIVIIADRSMSRKEYFDRIGEEENCSEWERFEYVAATRARHALLFMPEETDNTMFSAKNYGIDALPVLE